MSDDKNLPAVVQTTDLTTQDLQKIEAFYERGAPGFNLADEQAIVKMMSLYLDGKTYTQISRITRVPKDLIMAYAQRLNWYDLKMEYLEELQVSMRDRVLAAKMQSQDFLLQLTQMFQKKIGSKMDEYQRTGNPEVADSIGSKELDSYMKVVKTLREISEDRVSKPGERGPLVGLNVGDGAVLKQGADGSVEITPKAKATNNLLQQLADQRRQAEAAKTSDINKSAPTDSKEKQ